MLLVSKKERASRMDICRVCEHFVATTQSCGPLVTEAFTDSPLCGCHMPTKTRLKTAKCPLDKWQAQVTDEDLASVRHMLENKSQYTNEDLVQWYNKLTGENRSRTTCTPCNNEMVKSLRRLLQSAEDDGR